MFTYCIWPWDLLSNNWGIYNFSILCLSGRFWILVSSQSLYWGYHYSSRPVQANEGNTNAALHFLGRLPFSCPIYTSLPRENSFTYCHVMFLTVLTESEKTYFYRKEGRKKASSCLCLSQPSFVVRNKVLTVTSIQANFWWKSCTNSLMRRKVSNGFFILLFFIRFCNFGLENWTMLCDFLLP